MESLPYEHAVQNNNDYIDVLTYLFGANNNILSYK